MANIWWIALLLLPAPAHAQSGQSGDDFEPLDDEEVSCTSHISAKSGNSLTCNLGRHGDDESEEVEAVSLCSKSIQNGTWVCLKGEVWRRNRVKFTHLNVLTTYNLTAQLKGGTYSKEAINLRKIVKPTAPWVVNTNQLHTSGSVEIYIGTPYADDYLENNLLFQLHVWSKSATVPVRDSNYQPYVIEGDYLQRNTEYRVRVRAKPVPDYFDGFWSDWSPTVSFTTYEDRSESQSDELLLTCLPLLLAALLLITITAAFFWRKRILSLVWPSIPQPKHTLVQLYHPRKGSPMSFNPEVFGDLYFHLVQQVEGQDSPGPPHTDATTETKDQGLNQGFIELTSDHSTSTEGSEDTLESSEALEDHPWTGTEASSVGLLGPGSGPDTTQAELCDEETDPESTGAKEPVKDEAYVTMSSFYQVK